MSDADDSDEVDAIRERKRRELEQRAEGTTSGESPSEPSAAGPATPGEPIHVTGSDHLAELVHEHDVLLVDFYADWCGPCKMLEPTVETIAAETAAAVAKVDIDAHQDIAAQYQVQGVPTLYLFAGGEPAERMVGVQDEGTLRGLVQLHAA